MVSSSLSEDLPTDVKDTYALPETTRLDKDSFTSLSNAGSSQVLVCSAVCTHLGCIPAPYLGAYKAGFACATVPDMINSVALDKVPLKPTCHTSITLPTVPLFALRSRSSP